MQDSRALLPACSQVEVVQLLDVDRPYSGSQEVKRPPKIGDVGTVLHIMLDRRDDSLIYIVKKAAEDGKTVWLADFHAEELTLRNGR
jgi:hypothetical protein